MPRVIDLKGQRFGKLVVLSRAGTTNTGQASWLCQCDCGNKTIVAGYELRRTGRNGTKSCGCLRSEVAKKNSIKRRNPNSWVDAGTHIIMYANDGTEILIDREDWKRVGKWRWHIAPNGYVIRQVKGTTINIHREIMHPSKGYVVDHINHIKTDNRRSNLRICTCQENLFNRLVGKDCTSGTTGVCYSHSRGCWIAYLNKGEIKKMARFTAKEEAIKQRRTWEQEFYGEYAPQLEN